MNPRIRGDTSSYSGFGGKCQIRLRPAILTGKAKYMRAGPEYAEGRFRYFADVLFHEMIHQWHLEVTGQTETSYSGHGPAFRNKANEIGRALELPPVRTSKARGGDRNLPSCGNWPTCVRPDDYYLGAYIRNVPTDGDTETEGEPELPNVPADGIVETLVAMHAVDLAKVLGTVFNRRDVGRSDDTNGLENLFGLIVFNLEDERQCLLHDTVTFLLGSDEDDE